MKINFKMIVSSLIYGFVFLTVCICFMLVYKQAGNIAAIQIFYEVGMLACIAILLFLLCHRKPKCKTEEACMEYYSFIKDAPRKWAKMLCVVLLLVAVVSCLVNFKSTLSSDVIEHGTEVLTKDYDVTEESLYLMKALPQWFTDNTFISANAIYKVEELGDDITDDEANEILDDMKKAQNSVTIRAVAGFITAYIVGFLFYLLTSYHQYHSMLRRFRIKRPKKRKRR